MSDDDHDAQADVEWLLEAGVPLNAPSMQASLADAAANVTITMRAPCGRCGGTEGRVTSTGGQDVVRCLCGTFAYNMPRTESGKPQRSVRSRPDVKPSTRARVLATHQHRCVYCGRGPDQVVLHVDHMIPVELAKQLGFDMAIIESDYNLVVACEEENLGKGAGLDALSMTVMYMVFVAKTKAAKP